MIERIRITALPSTFTAGVVSALVLEPIQVVPLMEQQRYAPVENATHPRSVYPDHPSTALLSSIESKRDFLVHPVRPSQARAIHATASAQPRIGAFAREVGL